jgi:hypothetical protein
MALSLTQTDALAGLLKRGLRIASMGYPDLIFPKAITERGSVKDFTYREDSKDICKRHGIKYMPIPDAHSVFRELGCGLEVYDILLDRGCEILCDLNYPVDKSVDSRETYDIVLDVGTLEHCFNIGQALFNMAEMVKEGGYILHENPFNCGNHGFYNLNPTLFHDFYTQNGFAVEDLKLVTRDGRWAKPHPTNRFKFTPEELNVFCISKRIKVQSFVYPQQSKYAAAGHPGERDAYERAKGVANG